MYVKSLFKCSIIKRIVTIWISLSFAEYKKNLVTRQCIMRKVSISNALWERFL